jgi:hypothetical protein
MTRNQVKSILDRVLNWPAERQEDIARVIERMEEQDSSTLRLSDEQAAEVRRRMENPANEKETAEAVFRRIRTPER